MRTGAGILSRFGAHPPVIPTNFEVARFRSAFFIYLLFIYFYFILYNCWGCVCTYFAGGALLSLSLSLSLSRMYLCIHAVSDTYIAVYSSAERSISLSGSWTVSEAALCLWKGGGGGWVYRVLRTDGRTDGGSENVCMYMQYVLRYVPSRPSVRPSVCEGWHARACAPYDMCTGEGRGDMRRSGRSASRTRTRTRMVVAMAMAMEVGTEMDMEMEMEMEWPSRRRRKEKKRTETKRKTKTKNEERKKREMEMEEREKERKKRKKKQHLNGRRMRALSP